ncbi:MAG: hypothetical protein IID41_14535 [Planctomycetes bacterium]|nr:hypothetical protein [Planctomycetota bacterium]
MIKTKSKTKPTCKNCGGAVGPRARYGFCNGSVTCISLAKSAGFHEHYWGDPERTEVIRAKARKYYLNNKKTVLATREERKKIQKPRPKKKQTKYQVTPTEFAAIAGMSVEMVYYFCQHPCAKLAHHGGANGKVIHTWPPKDKRTVCGHFFCDVRDAHKIAASNGRHSSPGTENRIPPKVFAKIAGLSHSMPYHYCKLPHPILGRPIRTWPAERADRQPFTCDIRDAHTLRKATWRYGPQPTKGRITPQEFSTITGMSVNMVYHWAGHRHSVLERTIQTFPKDRPKGRPFLCSRADAGQIQKANATAGNGHQTPAVTDETVKIEPLAARNLQSVSKPANQKQLGRPPKPADVRKSDAKLFDDCKASELTRREFLRERNVDDVDDGIRALDRERKRREKPPA